MTKEQFLQILESDPKFSPGWQPAHFGTNLHARAIFGGDNFLDGYSIYQSENGYKHIVTYGMTELYGKTAFIQLVGITESELKAVLEDRDNVPRLIKLMKEDGNPNLVTDMKRTKSYL